MKEEFKKLLQELQTEEEIRKELSRMKVEHINNCLQSSTSSVVRFLKKKFFIDKDTDEGIRGVAATTAIELIGEYFKKFVAEEGKGTNRNAIAQKEDPYLKAEADFQFYKRKAEEYKALRIKANKRRKGFKGQKKQEKLKAIPFK